MTARTRPITRTVIVGGGSAGWMMATALARALRGQRHVIRLVESDAIGTVGVGEATVPPIQEFNRYLGIDPDAFLRATSGTIKLGIRFDGWNGRESSYFHPFGFLGVEMSGIHFHHFWLRHLAEGGDPDHGRLSLETMAAREGRFAPQTQYGPVHHAYQFDAASYGALLRSHAEAAGVLRTEGRVVDAVLNSEDGYIEAVLLENGERVEGDLFVDASGFRALLIGKALDVDYVDWTRWLPCDRAIALPSQSAGELVPYTRATQREAGWQWTIPLQHRTGNGYVYSSAHLDDDDALHSLARSLPGEPLADPNRLRFRAGHRRAIWERNCIALGLAGGFLEPLESTSIHLIQTTIIRLLALFPRDGIDPHVTARFNRDSIREYTTIRDFIVAHYTLAERETAFWQDVKALDPPDSLEERLEAFKATGNILFEQGDLFGPTNWYCVMTGHGVRPHSWHPIADGLSREELESRLVRIRGRVAEQLSALPPHKSYLS